MTDPVPAPLPTKPALESVSVWASIATFVLGILTQFGLPQNIAEFVGANLEQVLGAIMTLIAVIGGIGALRRKTLLRF